MDEVNKTPDVKTTTPEVKTEQTTPMIEKEKFDRLASDMAKLKKELSSKLSEDEKRQQEAAEKEARMKELEHELTKVRISAKLRDSGISANDAEKIAELGGNEEIADYIGKMFGSINEQHKKELNQASLNATPKPNGGMVGEALTKEAFSKLSLDERAKLKETNPALYESLKK